MVSLPSNISARGSVRALFCRVRVQFHVWHISLRTLPGCFEPTKTRAAWLSSLGQALLSGEREMRLLPTPHPGSISLNFISTLDLEHSQMELLLVHLPDFLGELISSVARGDS